MNSIKATGGGDACEDIFGGLEEVLKLDWKHYIRILVHVGDAPQHGSRFHDGRGDSYDEYKTFNEADPRGLKIENLLAGLKEKNILYNFGKINGCTDKMLQEFRTCAKDPDVPKDFDMSNPSDIKKQCVRIISASIDSVIMSSLSSRLYNPKLSFQIQDFSSNQTTFRI